MEATLDGTAYERLREAATTGRERLVVRLAGEAGVRPAEQTRLRPGDIDRRRFEGETHHFLAVRDEDDDPTRRTHLSADLAQAIDEYAATTGTDPDGRLIDVTPRRVQMLISEVATRAVEATGDERFEDVSSDELRRYFARRLLTETDVDPRVVREVGGWDRLAALDPYVGEIEDADIAAAFTNGHRPAIAADEGPSFEAAASVVALELDADGRVVGCSGALASLLGYPDDSVPGTPFEGLFAEEARERARPKELLATAGRDDVTVEECWFQRADGSRVRLSALVGALREDGRLDGFTVIVRPADADGSLAAGAFQQAVEAAGQPMCLASVTGEIEYANAAFEELTGFTQGEAVGRTADDLLSTGENTEAFYQELRETALDGETWTGQLTTRRKSGERVHVRQTVAPVMDGDEVAFFVCISTDVTERVRRERALARRCETLEGLETLVADINSAGRELIDASTREEIEAAVCESLADSEAYVGAWVGSTDPGDPRLHPREWAGLDRETTGAVDVETPAVETALDTGDPRVTGGDFAPDVVGPFDAAEVGGVRAAGVVPLAYGETTYGALVVFTDRPTAFGDRERTLLSDLGARIGHAVTAIERRNLLLADTVVELEFGCTDDEAFIVEATRQHGCSCTLEAVVPVSETSLLFYVTLSGAQPDAFLDTVMDADGVVDARYIREYSDRSLLEFTVEGDSPALTLTDLGATIRSAVAESGEATYHAEIAREGDVRGIVEGLQAEFPATDLRAKHAVDQSIETVAEFQDTLAESLTDKQRAALRAAYFAGYFDWPRGSTAEEVADSMDVSSPTFHNHLRKAERKLLASFFDHTHDHLGAEAPELG
ncbi:PAS domain S-box protein [Natronomonas halophila]|uniref:bacterio-opsin activator domain-containing protein n=1 Tax=Natronomonas halophila TaxID=2747817 RepID=UPI0015B50E16|nr:bacterio-opsin activator domain-containing protein [Natronomonas halophila]QLD86061.1 PAS domain S-box protein [Natronomonas halophila]